MRIKTILSFTILLGVFCVSVSSIASAQSNGVYKGKVTFRISSLPCEPNICPPSLPVKMRIKKLNGNRLLVRTSTKRSYYVLDPKFKAYINQEYIGTNSASNLFQVYADPTELCDIVDTIAIKRERPGSKSIALAYQRFVYCSNATHFIQYTGRVKKE